MADDKKLDLAKLLGGAKKAEPAKTATPDTHKPVEEKPKSGGLDLSKLLSTAKPATSETPSAPIATPSVTTSPSAPAAAHTEVQLTGKLNFTATAAQKPPPKPPPRPAGPQKPTGVGGQRAVGQVGQAGGVAKAAGVSALGAAFEQPQSAPAKEKALNAAAPSNRKLEKQMSTKGLAQDRLNVEQKEARKYPLAYFGLDEIWFCLAEVVNLVRVNVWRALEKYPKFILALESIGSERRTIFVEWDGENLSPMLEKASGEATFSAALDADDIIDHMRGKISCTQMELGPYPQMRGDSGLARTLHILHKGSQLTEEQREYFEEREAKRFAMLTKERSHCKTPIDWLERSLTMLMETTVEFVEEPIFFRVTVESEPKQEMIFHVEKKQLTTLVGKPGETLVPGAIEIFVSPKALAGLWDMECGWPFLFSSGQARATGDLDLLTRFRIVNSEIVRRIRVFNRLQKPIGPELAEYWLEVRKTKPVALKSK